MVTIMEVTKVLINLINVGIVFRVAYVFFQMVMNEDEVMAGKKRVINLMIVAVVVNLIYALKNLILSYYS